MDDVVYIDWCSRAYKLREVETAILTGEMVTEARFGSDMTKFATASLADVQKALAEANEKCAIQSGIPVLRRRRRFAMSTRARPY